MESIMRSVGNGGVNIPADVETIQTLLNRNLHLMPELRQPYADFGEAAEDYGKFLTGNPRYKPAFAFANDPDRFAEQLQKAGYATDPRYAEKLKTIISTYGLNEYEK